MRWESKDRPSAQFQTVTNPDLSTFCSITDTKQYSELAKESPNLSESAKNRRIICFFIENLFNFFFRDQKIFFDVEKKKSKKKFLKKIEARKKIGKSENRQFSKMMVFSKFIFFLEIFDFFLQNFDFGKIDFLFFSKKNNFGNEKKS